MTGRGPVELDLAPYRRVAEEINRLEITVRRASHAALTDRVRVLQNEARAGKNLDDLLIETFALAREVALRTLGVRAFDVQIMAGVALHQGMLVEMQTGEGKTLSAIFPAVLNALSGQGVHILTFNDYLARRDASWMGPIYEAVGLTVSALQEGMNVEARRAAYAADVMYATGKEVGFDFLREGLARSPAELVQRPYHFALVDEADSILIDEARVPLVIAGARESSDVDPYAIADVVERLEDGIDWEQDEDGRNVQLTDSGLDVVEAAFGCGNLHDTKNSLLLTELNQALHARALLHRNIDYIVRDGRIDLVDDFTGRVVADRRWPDGLQTALEAKEGLAIQPGGRILGSITVQHFLAQYPKITGMTATAAHSANELVETYCLRIVPIPPNCPCIREDLPDLIFTHRAPKEKALISEISMAHRAGRPVLVGTSSVEESERLAEELRNAGISCRVLNAKNDEAEAEIIAEAGAVGAVTISTNMAGRGTDIRLGGRNEAERERVVALGGLYVIGTNRHESRRIDDQLRGRASRQGDPGSSRFIIALDDPLMVRFGIDKLIPRALRPEQNAALEHPAVRREVNWLQRYVQGQNQEIRITLSRYYLLVEKQRAIIRTWRMAVLMGEEVPDILRSRDPERYANLAARIGEKRLCEIERAAILHFTDELWADHLAFVADVRDGIHLVSIGGMNPLHEFQKQISPPFGELGSAIKERTAAAVAALEFDLFDHPFRGPSSTWTYLINDRALTELQHMLFGQGNTAFSAGAVLMTWPLLLVWSVWRRISNRP